MKTIDVIKGNLTPINQNLAGALSASGRLVGVLISSEEKISGKISSTGTIKGGITIPPENYVNPYKGDYTVVSKPFTDEVLETKNHSMTDNVTVLKIPYYETGNETGYTVYIGGE